MGGFVARGFLLIGLSLLPLDSRWGRRRSGSWVRRTVIVVHPPHMISKVPLTWETVPWLGTVTAVIRAEVRLFSMAVHGMGLALMTQQTGSRRESRVLAPFVLASIGLKVGINKFAAVGLRVSYTAINQNQQDAFLLVVALELFRLVIAICLALPGAVK